jgi:hypothetical protein
MEYQTHAAKKLNLPYILLLLYKAEVTVSSLRSIKGKREVTRVFYGVETVISIVTEFLNQTNDVVYACVDQTRPILTLDILILKNAFLDAKRRDVKLLYITEITKDNLSYCRQLMTMVDELRHLDGIKGNFYISESGYLAPATFHEKGKPASQIIYSNVNEIIDHQRYVFDSFWDRAISADQKIREIEEGKNLQESKILYGVENAARVQSQMISNAKSKIDACLDSKSPSAIVKSQSMKKIMFDAINNRGIECRYITEINIIKLVKLVSYLFICQISQYISVTCFRLHQQPNVLSFISVGINFSSSDLFK